jgi:hypothetical protein
LSTYEYTVLEERYRKLEIKHRKLHKLATTYINVIRGFASQEDVTVSIEQLCAEAGNDGLRAKALEADALTSLVQEVGGLDKFISQSESVQALIDSNGGLQELEDFVDEAHMLRAEVDDVGGLQGLACLVSEVKILRATQHDKGRARVDADEPEVLKVKASKYDRLQQAFATIQNEPNSVDCVQRGFEDISSTTTPTQKVDEATNRKPLTSGTATTVHPARARLLSAAPHDRDPNRDLYEAARPFRKPLHKTGSNDVPLGSARTIRPSLDHSQVEGTLKRRYINEPQADVVTKRPRTNVGRASALVKASLDQGKATPSTNNAILHKPSTWLAIAEQNVKREQRDFGGSVPGMTTQSLQQDNPWHTHVDELVREYATKAMPGAPLSHVATLSETRPSSGGRVLGYTDRAAFRDSSHPIRSPVVKEEDMGGNVPKSIVPYCLPPNVRSAKDARVTVGGCPIALWIGSSLPGLFRGPNLMVASQIPSGLAFYLSSELSKYIKKSHRDAWVGMPTNPDTCIVRYLLDGHRPSGQPQERRACGICSSAWGGPSRPCAMLQDLEGVLTVVFLPLRDPLRSGLSTKDRKYWIMGGQ